MAIQMSQKCKTPAAGNAGEMTRQQVALDSIQEDMFHEVW